jgi:LuxR family transcriptional regulator, maltose regulon positive regulatory protein
MARHATAADRQHGPATAVARPPAARPRLLALLAQRHRYPVTVVAAPAGFGKTTLLTQSMAESRLARSGDAGGPAGAGIDAFVTARAAHAAASVLLDDLHRALGAERPASGQLSLAAVLDTMWHRAPEVVALLIDDAHQIPAGSPGAGVLAELIASGPANAHVVLAGREPLPVPLARLDVAGQVLRIGPAELAFTDEELAEFARQRGVGLDRLVRCGGWPALAELAAVAAGGVEAAYLWDEVLAGIEPGRRRELAMLASVGPLDEDLASAALDRPVGDLDALLADLPLVTGEPGGLRGIHDLWRRHLARCASADDLVGARRRVGDRLALNGDVTAAVSLLSETGAWDDVARVVLGALGADHPPAPPDVLTVWFDGLPPELRWGGLGCLLAGARLIQTDFPAAARQLSEAAALFRADGAVAGEMACLAQLALAAWWREDADTLATVAVRVLDLEAAGVAEAVSLACLTRALVHDATNECAAALDHLDGIRPGSLNRQWTSLIDWLRSLWLNHLGRPADALVAAKRAEVDADRLLAPLVEAARLQASWFLGDGDRTVRGLPGVLDAIEGSGLRDHAVVVAATCATALAYVGRPDEAAAYLARARTGVGTRVPLIDVNVVVGEAAVAVANGHEEAAARVLDGYLDRAELLGAGHAAAPQQRVLALWYVLAPRTRARWDAAELGPSFALARELARAVVAIRAGQPASFTEPMTAAIARAHLPLPWLTELALALIGDGCSEGWAMVETVWPAARPVVRDCARCPGPLVQPARMVLARMPVPPPGRFDLRLLGPVELRRDGVPVDSPEWRRERVRSLLAYLVLHRPAVREYTADELWPALDAEAQSRNLRVTLNYLLRVLEPDRAEREASFLIAPHGGALLLHRGEWFTADVWEFDELWARATEADSQAMPSVALGLMRAAVDLWRGPPNDLLDDWALPEVELRTGRMVALAVRASELLLAHDEHDDAIALAATALRADPWCDRAHVAAIVAHRAAGDALSARRAAARYRDVLDELGVDASARALILRRLDG